MKPVKAAAIYVRDSMREEAMDGQESKLRAWCAEHDIPVAACHRDCASSKTLDRPGLQEMLATIDQYDAVVVAEMGRLSMEPKAMKELLTGPMANTRLIAVNGAEIGPESGAVDTAEPGVYDQLMDVLDIGISHDSYLMDKIINNLTHKKEEQ